MRFLSRSCSSGLQWEQRRYLQEFPISNHVSVFRDFELYLPTGCEHCSYHHCERERSSRQHLLYCQLCPRFLLRVGPSFLPLALYTQRLSSRYGFTEVSPGFYFCTHSHTAREGGFQLPNQQFRKRRCRQRPCHCIRARLCWDQQRRLCNARRVSDVLLCE